MMDSISVEDSVTNKIVKQLTEDFESINSTLEYYQHERSAIVKAQNLALASYDYEIREIEGGLDADAAAQAGYVDHNVLRHLNIERDSDLYKKLESANTAVMSEKLMKNIEDLQTMPINHEVKPMPTLEEKSNMREQMFSFLDMSRMEETRLELEYDQAKARNDNKLAEEIAEALFLLQKNNCENLANMINDYRPAAFSKVWGNDADYNEMLKTFAVGVEEGGAGASGLPPKLSKAKKSGKRHA